MNSCIMGFNGERMDPVSGHYHLGNGYRAYSPELMRFTCPDSMSPFGAGGINSYAYCAGDPVNHADPTGHHSFWGWFGIGVGVALGALLTPVSGGSSLALALSAVSVTLAVVSTGLAVAQQFVEDSDPKAGAALGWAALGTGIISGLSSGVLSKVAPGAKSLAGLLQSTGTALVNSGLRGRGPMMAGAEAENQLHIPVDGVNPRNFRLLPARTGQKVGMDEHLWLDYTFEDTTNAGDDRLTIAVHSAGGQRSSRMALCGSYGDGGMTARNAAIWFRNNGYRFENYQRIRLLMCHSADGGFNSFAAGFSSQTGRIVTGFRGFLGVDGPLDDFIRRMDIDYPGNHFFTGGVTEELVNMANNTSELLTYSVYDPITFDVQNGRNVSIGNFDF